MQNRSEMNDIELQVIKNSVEHHNRNHPDDVLDYNAYEYSEVVSSLHAPQEQFKTFSGTHHPKHPRTDLKFRGNVGSFYGHPDFFVIVRLGFDEQSVGEIQIPF